ncbi:MAG: site-specific integrase [Rubrivivax sp.]|nr:site-specific integrase [Rubrivivax sp.]
MHQTNDSEASGTAGDPLPMYLHRRGRHYYFKRKIPAGLEQAFPDHKEQVWQTLDTEDMSEALPRLAQAVEDFERTVTRFKASKVPRVQRGLALAKSAAATTPYLMLAHVEPLLKQRAHEFWTYFDIARPLHKTPEQRQELQAWVQRDLATYREMAVANDYDGMEFLAPLLLKAAKLNAPPKSDARRRLLRELLRQEIEQCETLIATLNGAVADEPPPKPVAPRSLPTLLTLHESWRRRQDRKRTVATFERTVLEFHGLHGPLPVEAIGKDHTRQYRDELIKLDVTKATIENKIGYLGTLFRHGQRELVERLKDNPFECIDFAGARETGADEDRRPFEEHELQLLFNSPLYTQGYRPSGQAREASYWLPLMGAFTGARREEIAQLRVADVQRVDGSWCLKFTDQAPHQKLKTPGSLRRVPIHTELIQCGLLAYVSEQRVAGNERLFPSLRNDNENETWSSAFGTWFGRYLDDLSLTDARLDFHSFRYNFKQTCTLSDIGDEVKDALAGHWEGGRSGNKNYMRRSQRQYPYPKLIKAMDLFHYGRLDLGHLHVRDPFEGIDRL